MTDPPSSRERGEKKLRKQRSLVRCVISLRNKPQNCYHGGYILYISTGSREQEAGWSDYTKMAARTCSFISLYAKYAGIFEKQTPTLLSWPIYISIDFMLTTPFTSRATGTLVGFFSLFRLSWTLRSRSDDRIFISL